MVGALEKAREYYICEFGSTEAIFVDDCFPAFLLNLLFKEDEEIGILFHLANYPVEFIVV